MERWKTEDPCAGVDDLARMLKPGLWMNLLVADLRVALEFQMDVLGAEAIYRDEAFAIMRFGETVWMVHSDSTYDSHPIRSRLMSQTIRGTGCEIRLQDADPDAAEARARSMGLEVLEPAQDKPHGLREAFIVDPDGYVWVPSVLKASVLEAVA